MVPQFEAAAFKLDKGGVSLPFESQFGWHIVQVIDKRLRQPPPFDLVKDRIKAALGQQKAQSEVTNLRTKANVEFIDPAVRAEVEAEKAAQGKR
jgi:peptidyl-prolyl cis-trans isomerase C